MISDEDKKLFDTEEGLWFLDDNGRPVQATLEMPIVMDSGLISMNNHVFFNLHTRDSKGVSESIFIDDVESLKNSHFDPTRETKFVTHGWVNSKNSKACTLVRDGKCFNYLFLCITINKLTNVDNTFFSVLGSR